MLAMKRGVELTLEAKKRIDEIIVEAFRNRDRTFGNARFVFDLIEKQKLIWGSGLWIQKTRDHL